MEWVVELLHNEIFVLCAMAVIIFALTQVFKYPIKRATKSFSSERVRKMVNATILLIPFILGLVADLVYSTYITHCAFSAITGLGYGTASISLYGVVERFFKVKVENPYEGENGDLVKDFIDEVSKDGKVDGNDKHAVKDFWDKVK